MNMLYVNDSDDGIVGFMAKFVDDMKMGGVAGSVNETGCLLKDLDRLTDWIGSG